MYRKRSGCYDTIVSYELWDTETRNIVETFDSESEALEAARQLIAVNAPAYPGALALAFEDDEGESTLIARGASFSAWLHSWIAPRFSDRIDAGGYQNPRVPAKRQLIFAAGWRF